MGTEFNVELIERAFVEAAVDPTKWNEAMEMTASATGCHGALLFDSKSHLPILPRSVGMEGAIESYINDGWIERDERFNVVPYLLSRGVSTDFDLFTPDQMDKHPYYQEFLAPHGLRWFAGVKVAAGDSLWCLSLQRTAGQLPFSSSELAELANLSARLGAASAIARMLCFAKANAALEAFEMSRLAAVALDERGYVQQINASAERMMGSAFRIIDRRLCSFDRNATTALERALSQLLLVASTAGVSAPVVFPRGGAYPVLVYVLSLKSVARHVFSPIQAVVVLIDPAAQRSPSESALHACFALTPSEAKLAQALASGRSLDAVAKAFGISYETARNQLKSIFDKTGTHRQPELVSMLTRLCQIPV